LTYRSASSIRRLQMHHRMLLSTLENNSSALIMIDLHASSSAITRHHPAMPDGRPAGRPQRRDVLVTGCLIYHTGFLWAVSAECCLATCHRDEAGSRMWTQPNPALPDSRRCPGAGWVNGVRFVAACPCRSMRLGRASSYRSRITRISPASPPAERDWACRAMRSPASPWHGWMQRTAEIAPA
jgi:hypothetical protein